MICWSEVFRYAVWGALIQMWIFCVCINSDVKHLLCMNYDVKLLGGH